MIELDSLGQEVFEAPAESQAEEVKMPPLVSSKEGTWASIRPFLPRFPRSWVEKLDEHYKEERQRRTAELNSFGRPLKIGTPCAGFEAPIFALLELGIEIQHCFSLDVAQHAERFGHNLRQAGQERAAQGDTSYRSSEDYALLGKVEGDLLNIRPEDLPEIDVLVAGPPCPPWSTMGRREGEDDSRAQVFWKTISLIGALAQRGLQAFVLENVAGLKKKDANGKRGIDQVLSRLKQLVPDFTVHVFDMNSKHYFVAQNRPRVYIVGVRKVLRRPGFCFGRDPVRLGPPPGIRSFLAKSNVPRQFLSMPKRLVEKRREYWQYLDTLDRKSVSGKGWSVLSCIMERNPKSKFSAMREDGLTPALLSQSQQLPYVFLRRDREKAEQCFQRFLTPIEALYLQGFPVHSDLFASCLNGLTDKDVMTGAGNAMSVPVVGSVLAHLLVTTNVGRREALRLSISAPIQVDSSLESEASQFQAEAKEEEEEDEVMEDAVDAYTEEEVDTEDEEEQEEEEAAHEDRSPSDEHEEYELQGNEASLKDQVEDLPELPAPAPESADTRPSRIGSLEHGLGNSDLQLNGIGSLGHGLGSFSNSQRDDGFPQFPECHCWGHLRHRLWPERVLHLKELQGQELLGRERLVHPQSLVAAATATPSTVANVVSRKHATIQLEQLEAGWAVCFKQQGAVNGTWLYGHGLVGPDGVCLEHGQVLAFGVKEEPPSTHPHSYRVELPGCLSDGAMAAGA